MARGKQPQLSPIEQLNLYKETAQRLFNNQLIKDGTKARYIIEPDTTGTDTVITEEPAEDLLTGLLAIFRQFINNDEVIYADKVFNTLHICLTDDFLKNKLVECRKQWNILLKEDGLTLTFKGKELTPLFVTDMWINDALHSYMREADKEDFLKNMSPREKALARAKFFLCIRNAINNIAYVEAAITEALDKGYIDESKTK